MGPRGRRCAGIRAGLDGVPVPHRPRLLHLPGSAAVPRRLRLHPGIRHPALLPPGQDMAAGAGRSPPGGPTPGRPALSPGELMDFTIPDDRLAEHRDAARRWVAEHLPELPEWAEEQRVTGNYHTPELHRRLAEAGWLGAGWDPAYGGTDNDPQLAQAVFQEVAAAG